MMKIPQNESADYSGAALAVPARRTIPDECAGQRLDAALARVFPEHSRSRLQAWLKEGVIRIDDAPGEAKRKVHGGELISVDATAVSPAPTVDQAEAIELPIVYEDEHLIVINKPAGLVVHPGAGQPAGTMLNALLHHAPRLADVPRAGIVHRLDKDTTGLLVVAKNLIAQTDLVRQLQARSVKRHYLALALGSVVKAGTVDAPMGRHPAQRTKMAVLRYGGKEARTHYEIRERFPRCTLLECQLDTGRTHQIRVHLASIGHPIVGDAVYGKTCSGEARLDAFKRQALHAWRLALIHPESGIEMEWETPMPDDFSALLDDLRAAHF